MLAENYYDHKYSKIERYKELAAKNEQKANALLDHAHKMADVIPFGQPILVGHYSEKSDRNYRNRINNTYDKAFETLDKAKYYKSRALSASSNDAISSDAPDAIELLKEKLEKLESKQTLMKAANKIIKSKKFTEDQKIQKLSELGISEPLARELFKPDFCGRVGYADYETTNNNANIRRIKERIALLEKQKNDITTEINIGDITIINSVEENRIMITFPYVPSEEIRERLKSDGFRWSPSNEAWQAYRTAAWKIPYFVKFLHAMPGYVNPDNFLAGVCEA